MEQEIIDYISQAQKHGLSDVEIKQNLLNAGWEAGTVEQSFVLFKASDSKPLGDKTHMAPDSRTSMEQAVFPNGSKPAAAAISQSVTIVEHTEQPVATTVTTVKPKRSSHKIIIAVVVVVLLALAGSAYGYYALVLANPTRIWQKFTALVSSPIYQTQFDFNYSDSGELNASSSELTGLDLKDIKLSLTGSGYLDNSDSTNPQSNSKLQYDFSSGNTSFSTGFEYILQNKVLYLNVGDNPIFDSITAAMNNGQKVDWIKIDTTQLQNKASSQANESKFYQQITNPDFKAALEKIWQNTTIVKEDKYLGREKINGITTLHFQNSVDKVALKSLASQYITQFVKAANAAGQQIPDSDVAMANQIASQLVDKIQIQQFETWVGMTDFKLYQVHLVTNAPSVISFIKAAQSMQESESSDETRLDDVRQMAAALDLYQNDHNGYPDGSNGQPVGLSPAYIAQLPTAPAAQGTCTDYYNSYWYQPQGTPKTVDGVKVYPSYSFTFCLGGDSGGYKAGIGQLTQSGIQSNIPCPTTADQCVKAGTLALDPTQEMKQQITDFISKLDFSATITASSTYSNYGQKTTITLPVNALDIMQSLNQSQAPQASTPDAQRLADIRQLASAMELYFNDNNAYPNSLSDLAPKYIAAVPVSPVSTSSICTDQDHTYTYQKISGQTYTLNFCLDTSTGSYSAGKHTLTQAGIQ